MRRLVPTLALLFVATTLGCTSGEQRRRSVLEAADALLARGDRTGAVTALEGLLVRDPRDVAAVVRLAELDLEAGRYGRALDRLRSLPGDVPRPAAYFEALREAQVYAGPLEPALSLLLASADRPEEIEPDLVTTLIDRSIDQPWRNLPALPQAWRVRRAERLMHAGHLDEAREEMRRLPADAESARLLEVLIQAAMERDALAFLRATEELNREPATPWKLLARHRLLMERGDEGEAAQLEQRFLRRFPGHPRRYDVLVSRARRENRSGSPEAALRLADEALRLRPSKVEPLMEKSLALRELGRGAESEAALELVLALEPGNRLATLLLERGDEKRRLDRQARDVPSVELRIGGAGG